MDSPDRAEQYACLSYCWGHHPFLTTRFDTIDSYRRRIPWDLLPPTFQDAISFLRKLRIPYLWIDSLCIVQDDSNDWKRESSQMASIYQNAHLVISATKSANAYEGLFSQIGEEFQPHVLPVPTPEGYTEQVFFRRSLTHMRGPTNFGPRRETDLPTLSRGWIFQERLLATRVLHFGPQELLWECQGHSSCQCTVNRVTTPTNAAASFLSRVTWGARALQLKSSFNIRSWGSWSDRELSRCWHSLVEEYSRLHLTHETDIFPAFSGVAKRFQGAFRSEVLAGLWRKSLLADLLWHVQTQGERHGTGPGFWGRPESWRAPSWSWASVKCPVSYIDTSDGLDACCDILEAACEAAGIDPTGEVAGGSLILQGNLIPTDLNYSALSVNEVMPWNLYGLGVTKNKVSNVWADADTSVPGSNHLPQGSEVYCFPVGVGSISKAIECLLLRKVMVEKEAAYGIYERIGLVEVPRAPRDRLDQWVTSFKMSRTIKVI